MPLIGPITEGRSFFCPRCGAFYAVTYSRKSNSESNTARCVVWSAPLESDRIRRQF
jgi:predicted RNA-binding Zn-ribbon protein involved in translation (DUF1610 family)